MALQSIVSQTTDEPPIAILAFYGEVTSESVSEMDTQLDRLLLQCGRVVVDLAQTAYVSSAGWRSLVDRCSRSRPTGVVVACMQSSVRDVYDLLGMGYVLGAHDTVRDAVLALQQVTVQQPAVAPVRNPSGSTV